MKKALSLLLCLTLLAGCIPGALAARKADFTLMIYMCGTDLESENGMATSDLKEMIASGVGDGGDVVVYVQTGGTKNWRANGIDGRKAQRWTVSGDGLVLQETLGNLNMGAQDTLADFIASGFEEHPAKRYGLILWDHGMGATGGVCYDEITGDALYLPEIYGALQKSAKSQKKSKPFAFIGFDACLMATYEVAAHVEPFADYLVASEELEPGTGWYYTTWLKKLEADPEIDMESLGKLIVDSFLQATVQANRRDYATLSVTDLSRLTEIHEAVEGLGSSLAEQIDAGNMSALSRLRQNIRSFGEVSSYASDMIDLTTFAEVYARYDQENAAALKDALADAVVYSRHTTNLSGVTGLSILVPFSTRSSAAQYLSAYKEMELSPAYTTFVSKLLSGYSSGTGSYSFGNTSIGQQSIQSAQIDWFSQYAEDPSAYASDAGSLWSSLYGGDMQYDNAEDFSLGSFLSSLFGSESMESSFNADYDDSQTSLWGDASQYSDSSFAQNNGYGSGLWGSAVTGAQEEYGDDLDGFLDSLFGAGSSTQEQEVTVDAGGEEVSLNNPFADTDSEYAYTLQLTDEQLKNLGKVEANLMMDVSDPDFECYVELGYVQDVVTDWNSGKIYGMFDGSWATLDGQMVCMYDQIANAKYIRSLIPALLNGEEYYILVIFDEENPGGVVAGATVGYTEAGTPARNTVELEEGDEVIPMYELLYWDENGEQQSEPFEGDPIIVGADGTIPFAFTTVEEDADYVYGFCLTDVYGDYQYSDFISLSF